MAKRKAESVEALAERLYTAIADEKRAEAAADPARQFLVNAAGERVPNVVDVQTWDRLSPPAKDLWLHYAAEQLEHPAQQVVGVHPEPLPGI